MVACNWIRNYREGQVIALIYTVQWRQRKSSFLTATVSIIGFYYLINKLEKYYYSTSQIILQYFIYALTNVNDIP